MKIRTQLLVFVLGIVLVSFGSVLFITHQSSKQTVLDEIHLKTNAIGERYRASVDGYFLRSAKVAIGMAQVIKINPQMDKQRIHRLLIENLRMNHEIYGTTIFFEPSPEKIGKELFAPYFFRHGQVIKYIAAEPTFNFKDQSWYKKPREEERPIWTEPYYDQGARMIMTTYSVPINTQDGFLGLATIDISLEKLSKEINAIRIGENGYALLLSQNGTFLTHPDDSSYVLKQKISDVVETNSNSGYKKLVEKIMKGERGSMTIIDPFTKKKTWASYSRMPSSGYSLLLFLPEEELFRGASQLSQQILYIGSFAIVFLIAGILLISFRLANPILALSRSARKIAKGNLDEDMPKVVSKNEIGTLTQDISTMVKTIKDSLASIRAEKNKFEAVFTNMSDAVVAFDLQWNIINFNEAAKKFLEITGAENFLDHISKNFESTFNLGDLIDYRKQVKNFELTKPETDQSKEIILSAVINTIVDLNGNVTTYVLTTRDITAERQEELSKSTLLSLISHKLRTPITVLLSNTSLLKEKILGELNEKQDKSISKINLQAQKVQQLVDRLINYVTVQGSERLYHFEEIHLADYLEEFKKRIQIEGERKVNLSIEPAPKLGKLRFNPEYLKLILSELVENAAKFNSSETAEIKIKAHQEYGKFILEISDNGIGIPSIHQDKIFERFFQVDKHFTGNTEGMGLGLSLIKSILNNCGGHIKVKTKEGLGSTFIVDLPK